MRPHLLTLLFALLLSTPALAQQPVTGGAGPRMLVTDGKPDEQLQVTRLDVQSRIVGHLVQTSMTMTFFNPSGRVVAGDLVFPLPSGATVSGYALDVNGVLVDGVVVDKQEARRIFEEETRKGVDPGLVERVAGAAFRTRVFPIAARGERTLRVSYVSELVEADGRSVTVLPLGLTEPVAQAHIRVEVVRAGEQPRIEGAGLAGLGFDRWEDRWVAETTVKNARLDHSLRIAVPDAARRTVAIERASDGFLYAAVHDRIDAPNSVAPLKPKRVALLWDASASRESADHAREIELIRRYLEDQKKLQVDLVIFGASAAAPESFELPRQADALVARLKGVVYDGGTQLGSLAGAGAGADLILLVSDGVSNFGLSDPGGFAAPVFAINGQAVANHDALRALSLASGGAWIDLSRLADRDALAALGRAPFAFRSAQVAGAAAGESYPRIAEPVTGVFSWVTRLEGPRASVTLRFGVAGGREQSRRYELDGSQATEGDLLRRFWAGKKVADLAIGGQRNEPLMAAVGKEFGLVTPGTSLLVLETLEQYVEHGVRPPASLASMRTEWDRQLAERGKAKQVEEASKLEAIVALWAERVAWWETDFVFPEPGSKGGGKDKLMLGDAAPAESMEDEAAMPASASVMGAPLRRQEARPEAKKSKEKSGPDAPPPPSIALRPWNPQTPYIAALRAAEKADQERVYLQQRAEYGAAPAFFLDTSDFFRDDGQAAIALRVLSNLAELELEEPALLRILGHRLVQVGELDLAISTYERVLELRPDEPQSHRDLALAFARRGDRDRESNPVEALADYQRALDGLADVVMERWDRFAEIELIALVELNNVLPKAQALGSVRVPVDQRLVRALDMDVRITMSWDADMTDMDMHIVEPSGDEAYYGHNRTRIGGRVSRDFTQGYGPEEYTIRKAMKGTYTVRTKFFGSSAAQLQGAVTLSVDIWTDYGRPEEQRQSVTIRLTENKETFTVGEIVFSGPAAKRVTR